MPFLPGSTASFFLLWTAAIACFGGVQADFLRAYPLLAAALLALAARGQPGAPEGPSPGRAVLAALAGLGALLVLQMIPWPTALLRLISPLAYRETVVALEGVGVAPRGAYPLSVDPVATAEALATFLGFVGVFLSAILILGRDRARDGAILSFLGLASLVALVGLVHLFSGSTKALWLFPRGHTFFGPFLNRNHAGGMIACASIVSFGLLYSRRLRRHRAWIGGAFLLCLFALFFIGSRASLLTSLAFCAFHFFHQRRRIPSWARLTAVLAGGAVLLLSISWEAKIFDRFTGAPERRVAFFRDALTLWKDAPLLGSGAGSFAALSPRLSQANAWLHPEHVENDYVEILSTAGLAGAALAGLFLFLLARAAIRGYRAPDSSARARASALAFLGLLFHAALVFHLPVPAQHFLFALLLIGFLPRDFAGLPDRVLRPAVAVAIAAAIGATAWASFARRSAAGERDRFRATPAPRSAAEARAARLIAADLADEADAALARRPSDDLLWHAAARTHLIAGDRARGETLARAALDRAPFLTLPSAVTADLLIQSGALATAENHWERRVGENAYVPSNVRAQLAYHLAFMHLRAGDHARARVWLDRATRHHPGGWQASLYRFFLTSDAMDLLRSWDACPKAPGDSAVDAWNAQFRALARGRDFTPALRELAAEKPDVAELLSPGDAPAR